MITRYRTTRRITILLGIVMLVMSTSSCRMFSWNVDSDSRSSELRQDPPPQWTAARDLTVVTYNVKDMWYLTDHRPERMREIGARLAAHSPDVVCLQEGFLISDIEEIIEILRESAPLYVRDFPSGALGSGLWILSRYPIVEAYFCKFDRNGHWWEVTQGDWWAGKGMGLARLELAPDTYVDVYNTHFIAGYYGDSNSEDRFTQAAQSMRFIRRSTPSTIPALVLGDFNSSPSADAYEVLTKILGLEELLVGGIDHVFGFDAGGGHSFDVLEVPESIGGSVQVGEERVALSDHRGQIARVRIQPRTR